MTRRHQPGVWREVPPTPESQSYAIYRTYEFFIGRRKHASATIWGEVLSLTPKGEEAFSPTGMFGRQGWTVEEFISERKFVWHTWDASGTGGENASDATLELAMYEAEVALLRQGWW